MKVAVVGSRGIVLDDLGKYLPCSCSEIISGGATGVDTCAAEYARSHGIKLTEYLPDYRKYGRAAPIVRNKMIVEAADCVIAFWDGSSRGTLSVIGYCKKRSKPCTVLIISTNAHQGS